MNDIPLEIKKYFPLMREHFEVSKFEEYLLNDIYEFDESSKIKLNRDVTEDFIDEIELFLRQKKNIRILINGATREGKSLVGLKIGDIILNYQKKDFATNIYKVVCGNQKEYRQRLQEATFGDFYLIDENAFDHSGLGANIETMQLKDFNSQIAKKNISLIFITPDVYLRVGATMKLATYGRDSNNWLSRMLVYKIKENIPYLIGYIIIDVGALFRKYGCFLYKYIGGCNNTEKKKIEDIPLELINNSFCIPKQYDKTLERNDLEVCPFYNVCKHALCTYEHKKDSWIDKEMKGGLNERTEEQFKLSILMICELYKNLNIEKGMIHLDVSNKDDLTNNVKLMLNQHTNTKMGVMEFKEFISVIISNCKIKTLFKTLKTLENEKLNDLMFNISKDATENAHLKNEWLNYKEIRLD